jgi:hypothetical protein
MLEVSDGLFEQLAAGFDNHLLPGFFGQLVEEKNQGYGLVHHSNVLSKKRVR